MGKDQVAREPTKEGLGDILFDPKEKAKIDIVFVHGLGGDRTETYFAHFYPLSPKTIAPELTIDNYSTSLLQALAGLREKSETTSRPIIFVAHSLGGLVVANALARPHGTEQAAKEIADRTVGTVFLGTPFEGSSIAKFGHAALGFLSHLTSTQTANLEALQKRSEKLTGITHLFGKFLRERDRSQTLPYMEVACFFEDRPLYKGPLKIGIIVPKESAGWLGVDAISIPKDHQEMCRFEDEDGSDYKSVAAKLRQLIAKSEKPREAGKGGLLGANAQSIGVYQGNVDQRGVVNNGGIVAGNLQSDAQNGVVLTGTVNQYSAGSKPPF